MKKPFDKDVKRFFLHTDLKEELFEEELFDMLVFCVEMRILEPFLFAAVCIQLTEGNFTWENASVQESLVEIGSIITLVGISNEEKPFNRSSISWLKDGHLILQDNVLKYKFLRSGTVLVINGFMAPDAGCYVFFHSHNSTNHKRAFYLGLLPHSLIPWYRRNPKVVGTITGLIFLTLMMLALVYYCCTTDIDPAVRALAHKKQTSLPYHVQNAKDYNYSGVKFSTGVQVAANTGRPKSCREVRHESIITLGAVSKQSIDRLKKMRATRNISKPLL